MSNLRGIIYTVIPSSVTRILCGVLSSIIIFNTTPQACASASYASSRDVSSELISGEISKALNG